MWDRCKGVDQQYRAVASGYWPLMRYDPLLRAAQRFHTLDDLRGRLAVPADHGEAARERASYVSSLWAAGCGDGPGDHRRAG